MKMQPRIIHLIYDWAISFAYVVLLALLSLYVMTYTFGTSNMLKKYPNTSIISMVDGQSPKPFIYRTLVPQITHVIMYVSPDEVVDAAGQFILDLPQAGPVAELIKLARWRGFYTENILDPVDAYKIGVVFVLLCGFLMLYGMQLRTLSRMFFPAYKWLPYLTSVMGLLLLVPFIKNVSKIYDFPLLALFSLSLLFLYQQKWGRYLMCFALATINKESSLLLMGFFVLLYMRHMQENRKYLYLFIAQAALYLAIISGIHTVFDDVRGSDYWFNPVPLLLLHFRDFNVVHMMVLGMIFWLITSRWQELPVPLRKSLWLLVACAGIYYLFGKYREYRVFFECFPMLTVIAGYTLFSPLEKIRPKEN